MALMEIHLQEGWDDDHVQVTIDRAGFVDQYSVSTDYSLGLAWMERFSIPAGEHEVEVEVPIRQLSERLSVVVEGEFYLGIRIDNDQISFVSRSEPFVYF